MSPEKLVVEGPLVTFLGLAPAEGIAVPPSGKFRFLGRRSLERQRRGVLCCITLLLPTSACPRTPTDSLLVFIFFSAFSMRASTRPISQVVHATLWTASPRPNCLTRGNRSICARCSQERQRSYATYRSGQRSFCTNDKAFSGPFDRRKRKAPSTTYSRGLADVSNVPADHGPLAEYDERVHSRRLRDDEHQRAIVEHLQDLHDMLKDYHAPPVVHPDLGDLQPQSQGMFSSLFRSTTKKVINELPANLPKGLYMFGDVGSGKTMLMDLFFDTLPANITSKTRIHFHNFMQDVHKRLHKMRMQHGSDFDAVPYIAADIAETAQVLAFDEFQCTDVADAMILRRLLEALMSHGVVLVTTSNRHPDDLYKNGIQRQSFIPCINLLKSRMRVINLDSSTDYRKLPRPPGGVYHHPLDKAAKSHVEKWFQFLGDPENDPPHSATVTVWGREVEVPSVSGKCARFTFHELIGRATGAADYIEMMRSYDAFIVTDIPGMSHRERDWARRFITFIDAVYESHAKLVLTTAVPLSQLFMSRTELDDSLEGVKKVVAHKSESFEGATREEKKLAKEASEEHNDVDDVMRNLMDDLGMSMTMLKNSALFSGDEERFAFARALSRLSEMGSQDWVERGLGMEKRGGLQEREGWQRVRSRWREDSL